MMYARFGGDFEVENKGRLLRRTARLAAHLKWQAMTALGVATLATAARLFGPLAVRSGIDDGITAGDRGHLTVAALAFLGFLAVQYVAQRSSQFLVAALGEQFLLELRKTVFRHFMNLDMAYYSKAKTGVVVSRMTSDIEAITAFASDGAITLVTNLLTAFGVAVAMLVVDWRLAVTVFALILVLIGVSYLFQRFAGRAYRQVQEQIGRVLARLQEGITGVRVVQAFTQERAQGDSFGSVNEAYYRANMRAAANIAWYFPIVALLRTIGIALVLLVGGRRVLAGDLTFGSLVVFLLYLDWFFQPIINLSNIYNLMQAALAGLSKLFGVLDTRPAIREHPGARDFPEDLRGEVRFEGVAFGYRPDVPVLHDVDLAIAPGERVAIVGETGAGKSTLARLALRFYDPTSGRVLIDGVDLRDITFDSRAHHVALIPQEGFLFNGSLRDNIRYPRPSASDDAIWEVCRALGIEEWVRSLPERLDTEVRERGTRFSAGERQFVALARALIADPTVIVLDEATANLDPENEVRVERALSVVLSGRTSIVIAHRLRSAERADRVVMVDGGRIVAVGSHQQLLDTSEAYGELVRVWQRGVLQ